MGTLETFFHELRRRHAFRVAAGYLVAAWLLIQVADTVLPAFEAPGWALKTIIVLVVAGFPVAIAIAWAFELTPEGLERAEPAHDPKTATTGRKFDYAILGGLLLVVLLIGVDRLMPERPATREGLGDALPARALSGDASPSDERVAPATFTSPWEIAPPPEKSVAVLPFLAMSSGRDDGHFADGLTEEIINRLTTLPELLVTARTSAFHFKETTAAVPEIAAMLGVAHVVEGSVRRSGDQVRITAQLIRAVDGFHVWSETYDRRLDDVFAVQTDIAENIADALGVLLDDERRETMAEAGVRDVEAFLAFQRGQALYSAAHNEPSEVPTLIRANAELDAAIERKPDFAQAYFMRSDLFIHVLTDELPGSPPGALSLTGLSMGEAATRFTADLDAAFRHETDPGQRQVIHVVRKFLSPDWHGLDADLDRAFQSWKNCRDGGWISTMAVTFGRAVDLYRKSLEMMRCDRLNDLHWYNAATAALVLGRPEETLRLVDEAERLVGRHFLTTDARIQALFALQRHQDAERILAAGTFTPFVHVQVHAAAGRKAEAMDALAAFGDGHWLTYRLVSQALIGDLAAANRIAATIDATPLGAAMLAEAYHICLCGAPFELAATPGFARQVKEGNLAWPPPVAVAYPLKTW